MLNQIEQAGIIGAGGAGFPAHVKLGAEADIFIVNAAECEPLLYSDKYLMLNKSSEIIKGIDFIKKLTKSSKAYIGIKEKNSDCAEILKKIIGDRKDIEVKILRNSYPSGDEQVMIYEITGRIVPEGGIPLNIGVIVNNVETVYRVYNALENKKPFTKRYVTVTGDINKPFVAEIPVGVSFSHILELAGKKPGLNYIAVDGGPMMGKITEVDKGFIKKTTSGIIFLDKKSILIQRKTQNIKNVISQAAATCCNCVTCTDLCSRYLIGHKMEPHKIMRAIFNQNLDNKLFETAFLCSECNICELYACPLNLSPRTVNVFLKDEYRKKGKRPEWDKRELSAPEFREGRLVPSERLINRLGLGSFSKIKPDFREKVEIPEKLYIFTNSHIGAPAEICVKQGDTVLKNQNIAVKNGNVSANYHSPTDGIVSEVQENLIVIEVKK